MDYLKIASDALNEAKAQLEASERHIDEFHGERDFTTNIDYSIEKIFSDHFRRATPDIPLIGEEFTPENEIDGLAWVVDPIDGTVNFFNGHPLYGISVALVSSEGGLASIIYLPELKKLYES